jgi:hypothetical protein
MLGRKEEHHMNRVMLSQGTFAARLQELITKDASRDARLEKLGQPLPEELGCLLRKYYLRNEDPTILKIMQNYFEAARETFVQEWESDSGEFVIRKTVGYTALIKVLNWTLPQAFAEKDLSLAFFQSKFAQFRENLGATALTSDNFPSSGDGANKLFKTLVGELQVAVE